MRLLLLCLAFVCLCGFSDEEQSIADAAGVDTLSHPTLTQEQLDGESQIVLWDELITLLQENTGDAVGAAAQSFAALMAVLVLCSLLHASEKLCTSPMLAQACSFVCTLAVSGVCYALLHDIFSLAGQALQAFAQYLAALLPVTASLLVSGGNVSAAAASGAGFSLFLSAISLICSAVLFPFLQISFSTSFICAVPAAVDLSSIGRLVRNTAGLLLLFLFSLLGFMLTMQTTISSASDSFLFRSVKFAPGVLIPVVGNILGDAARTVAGSVSVIKGTVGAVGTVVTLAILIPPLLHLLCYRVMLSLSGTLAKMLGCEREGQLLAELGATLNVLMGLLAGSEVIALLFLATFIKTGVTV